MTAITKRGVALWALLIPLVAIISFFIGRNYQKMVLMYDQYALFMNLSGEYIDEFNEVLSALETEGANSVLYVLNQRVINEFGCSPWIHRLVDMDHYNLDVFKSAVQGAFEDSGSMESLDEECIGNLRKYGILPY